MSNSVALDMFHPIQASSLQEGRVPNIDLYIQRESDEKPILFLSRSLPVDHRIIKNISESDIQNLWVADEDFEEFEKYLNRNLASIIRDSNVPIHSRCSLTYDLSVDLMEQVYKSADPIEVMKQSEGVLNNIIEVIFADPNAAHSFITLASMDYHLYSHSINVCLYGMALARKALNISKEEALTRFGPGLLLHDIGILSIDHELLNKPGPLSEDEMALIKEHPQKGLEVVEGFMEVTQETKDMILHHHERLDGSGYPEGLKGKYVSVSARICAIVDSFDAISTNRCFQTRSSSFDSFNTLKKEDTPHKLDDLYLNEFIRVFLPLDDILS
jgi:HD-GYP domain-containing protein (c-di-GMP phosphodiesterase class II)